MPSTSKKQHNFMAAIAKNPAFAKKVGVKQEVGQEFLTADKGKKFGSGGKANNQEKLNNPKVKHGKSAYFKEGGDMKKVKKMAFGGLPSQASPQAAVGMANRPAMPAQSNAGGAMRGLDRAAAMSGRTMPVPGKPAGMKKGGMCEEAAKKEVKSHEKKMHKMAKGGVTRADGCVSKGHTKGKMV